MQNQAANKQADVSLIKKKKVGTDFILKGQPMRGLYGNILNKNNTETGGK